MTALQRQLTDARCYTGPLDGKVNVALRRAVSVCADPRPKLRIETGMHVSLIKGLGADAQCRVIATGSHDKTVRLWAMPEGRLIRTLRLPIGDDNGGKVYAVAVSPDGSLVAAGGWDAANNAGKGVGAYLFDATTGTRLRRLGGFPDVILRLAFSPDGRRLAVALNGGHGIRVLDVATGREVMADRDYGGQGTYGAAFGPDGALYAAGFDGFLRRYGPDLKLSGRVAAAGGKRPFSVAVDPSNNSLAVGYDDTTAVDVYDPRSLLRIGPADTTGIDNGDLSKVAWLRDGSRLVAGGRYQQGGRLFFRRFTAEGRQSGADLAVSDSTIFALAPCGDGTVYAVGEPSFGLVRPDGGVLALARTRAADMRAKLDTAFAISADGTRVRFGLGYGAATPVLFDLAQATLTDAPDLTPGLGPPNVTGLPVTGWASTNEPRFRSSLLARQPNDASDTARSLAVRTDRAGFVLGTEYLLRTFDVSGRERWRVAGPGVAWGVNLARGGDLIVAAYDDGTIRWRRWSDGGELLALFVNADSRAWVAWTPSGYYAASPGGEDLIGWQVNRGWEQPADFFPASKFRDQYARPDIVERVLATLDETAAVRQANAAMSDKPAEATPIAERLPPVVSILSPSEGTTVSGEEVRLEYLVRSPSGLPVDGMEALVNGRPSTTGRGLGRTSEDQEALRRCLTGTRGLGRDEGGQQGCRGSVSLRLPPGTSEVGLFARSGSQTGDVARIRLVRPAAPAGAEPDKPRLFALVVGISTYANPDYRLAFAAKDAADFASALQNQQGGLYREVTVRALDDGAATAAAIRDGLDWLRRQVTSRDVGLVYLAGHGLLDERERFYFLSADGDADRLRATAVPREDIQDALDGLAGKALLFLDACHAGAIATGPRSGRGLNINTVANEFASSEHGVVAFTASTGRQLSQENPAWGNGAFTKAVTEALGMAGVKAKGDLLGTGRITTSALDVYVSNRVKALTNGEQSPIMIRPPTVPDFTLAVPR